MNEFLEGIELIDLFLDIGSYSKYSYSIYRYKMIDLLRGPTGKESNKTKQREMIWDPVLYSPPPKHLYKVQSPKPTSRPQNLEE